MAKNNNERRQLLSQAGFFDGRDNHTTNLEQAIRSESLKESFVTIFSDPECSTRAHVTPYKSSKKAPSSVLKPKSTNITHKRRTCTQKENGIDLHDKQKMDLKSPEFLSINNVSENKPDDYLNSHGECTSRGHDRQLIEIESNISSCQSALDACDSISINGRSYALDIPSPWPLPKKGSSMKNTDLSFENDPNTCVLSNSQVKTEKVLYDPLPISPFTKALVTALSPNCCNEMKENNEIAHSATVALIEKNKTLMKEVRFAEQTCVEVGEKNAAMENELMRVQRDNQRLKEENQNLNNQLLQANIERAKLEEAHKILLLTGSDKQLEYDKSIQRLEDSIDDMQKVEKGLRNENVTLQKRNIELTLEYTKLQEGHNVLLSTLAEKDATHRREIEILQEKLDEVRCLGESFMEGLEESNRAKASLEMELVDIRARHETLLSELIETKAHRDQLIRRSNNDTSDNISNKNIEIEALKNALIDLQGKYRKKCDEMDALYEKIRDDKRTLNRSNPPLLSSPTRAILAETLRAELERNHANVSRLIELEKIQSMNNRLCFEFESCAGKEFSNTLSVPQNTFNPTSTCDQTVAVSQYCDLGDVTNRQTLAPCTHCESISKDLNCATHRIQELEKDLDKIKSLQSQGNGNIKQKLQETFESMMNVADSIECQCNQRLEFYSGKLEMISDFLASFQKACTFMDKYEDDDDDATGPCNDDREHMRARMALLRSNLQSIQESLGNTEDDIESMFDEPQQVLFDEIDDTIQKVRCTPRENDDVAGCGHDIAISHDVTKTSKTDDSRITVVVNLYTK